MIIIISHEKGDGDKLMIINLSLKAKCLILVLFTFCIPSDFSSEIISMSFTFCL